MNMGFTEPIEQVNAALTWWQWSNRILSFNQTYLDKAFSEIDLTNKDLQQLNVIRHLICGSN